MWMAMECSVTVSMGEEMKGVLREMRLVTGVSSVTALAGKPVERCQYAVPCALSLTSIGVPM